jgi:hypothetical protein
LIYVLACRLVAEAASTVWDTSQIFSSLLDIPAAYRKQFAGKGHSGNQVRAERLRWIS